MLNKTLLLVLGARYFKNYKNWLMIFNNECDKTMMKINLRLFFVCLLLYLYRFSIGLKNRQCKTRD